MKIKTIFVFILLSSILAQDEKLRKQASPSIYIQAKQDQSDDSFKWNYTEKKEYKSTNLPDDYEYCF